MPDDLNGWILTAARLPPVRELIIVIYHCGGANDAFDIGEYQEGDTWAGENGFMPFAANIKMWLPIPQPPTRYTGLRVKSDIPQRYDGKTISSAAPEPVESDPIEKIKAPSEYGTIEEVRAQVTAIFSQYKIEVAEVGGGATEPLRYNLIISFGNPPTYTIPAKPGMDRGDYVRARSYRRFDNAYVAELAREIGYIDEYHATLTALRKRLAGAPLWLETAIQVLPLRGWQAMPIEK
jgi:hypothetical protein